VYLDNAKLFKRPNLTIDYFRIWKIEKKTLVWESLDASTIISVSLDDPTNGF